LTATPTGPADQLPLSAESGSVVESAPVATNEKPRWKPLNAVAG
jgi:hypothetical protein